MTSSSQVEPSSNLMRQTSCGRQTSPMSGAELMDGAIVSML